MKYLILFTLIANIVYSQEQNSTIVKKKKLHEYEFLTNKDTLYVKYTGKQNQIKNETKSNDGFDYKYFLFFTNTINYFSFFYSNSTQENKPPSKILIESKSFIRKNKNQIIDINFLKEIENPYSKFHSIFYKNDKMKVLFLIDYKEKKNENFYLYPVKVSYHSSED